MGRNIDILDDLQNDDENDALTVPKIVRKNLKWGQEEIFDEIIVEHLD